MNAFATKVQFQFLGPDETHPTPRARHPAPGGSAACGGLRERSDDADVSAGWEAGARGRTGGGGGVEKAGKTSIGGDNRTDEVPDLCPVVEISGLELAPTRALLTESRRFESLSLLPLNYRNATR